MVRVIWVGLFGWTNVDDLLHLILDLSIAVHDSAGVHMTRLCSVGAVHGRLRFGRTHGSVGTHLHDTVGTCPSAWSGFARLRRGSGARLGRDVTKA